MAEMTREEVYAWLDKGPQWTRMATIGKDGYPHVVPLGYFRLGDEIILNMRGQHELNVRRNPKVSLVMDEGSSMTDLKGAIIRGDATLVEDPAGCLELTRAGARARGVAEDQLPTEPRPNRSFARVKIDRIASWDNAKR
ncbi:MAG: pyridoxamine 5'-phosphate oxidase family protein [Chloroflexi bacterium]|nr:pyridoxamine 5'-phosphate oxidase family protein [Chloroflexota bacterium]MDA1240139.1 pyridoxamine 5'-phosphate oxidase family protein [Chloroflexota bacterium]